MYWKTILYTKIICEMNGLRYKIKIAAQYFFKERQKISWVNKLLCVSKTFLANGFVWSILFLVSNSKNWLCFIFTIKISILALSLKISEWFTNTPHDFHFFYEIVKPKIGHAFNKLWKMSLKMPQTILLSPFLRWFFWNGKTFIFTRHWTFFLKWENRDK